MLIAIAAAAAVATTQPGWISEEEYQAKVKQHAATVEFVGRAEAELVANRCAAKVLNTNAPVVRYDRGAADPGGLDQQPYLGEVQLFSAVELKVDGCSLPVIRTRATKPAVIQPQALPLDR